MSDSTNFKEQAFSKKKINYLKNRWLIHIAVILLATIPPILTSPYLQFRNYPRPHPHDDIIAIYSDSLKPLPPPYHKDFHRHRKESFKREKLINNLPELFFFRALLLSGFMLLIYLLNVLYWVKILIQRKNLWAFISIVVGCMIAFTIFNLLLNYTISGDYFGSTPNTFIAIWGQKIPIMFIALAILPVIGTFAVSTGIEVTNEWIKQDEQRQLLENEKLQAELDFLKFQINPHFLFNTLNNIYSLAGDKSDTTEEAILMLSHLLRYTIYESNVHKIQLSKEVEQIENYINLQKLRLSAKKRVEIHFDLIGDIQNHWIAPMLLIPFIENAFKHGISYLNDSVITIYLKVETNQLTFSVVNQKNPGDNSAYEGHSGIGLKNVQRRLDLIYPQQYNLNIQETEVMYKVELILRSI